MKRLYLVDTQVKELVDCLRNRICMMSADLRRMHNLEEEDKLCDRINVLSDILDTLTEED